MTEVRTTSGGELLVALSNRIVAIYKELYGKGPVKVRSWYLDDVVVCVLRGALTRSEQTFVEIGRGDRVVLQRDSFHEVAEPVFMEAVEELTGRHVETVLTRPRRSMTSARWSSCSSRQRTPRCEPRTKACCDSGSRCARRPRTSGASHGSLRERYRGWEQSQQKPKKD